MVVIGFASMVISKFWSENINYHQVSKEYHSLEMDTIILDINCYS